MQQADCDISLGMSSAKLAEDHANIYYSTLWKAVFKRGSWVT